MHEVQKPVAGAENGRNHDGKCQRDPDQVAPVDPGVRV